MPSYTGNPYYVNDKAKQATFQKERDFILVNNNADRQGLDSRYEELITILDEACGALPVEMESYLSVTIGDWIHNVQRAIKLGDVKDEDSFKKNAKIDWGSSSRIFELKQFLQTDEGFCCIIKLKKLVDPYQRTVKFDQKTHAASYVLPSAS